MKSAYYTAQKPLLVAFLAIVALAQVHAAWGVTVRAQLERPRIQLGDSVRLQIIVTDSPGATITPQIPRIDGLSIRPSGTGVQWINGRRSDTRNYFVTPTREGKFVIPPIPVRVGGQTFRTNRVVLTASKTPESAEMRLVASVSKKECYLLQPIDVTFDWYISSDVRSPELNIPLLLDKDELSLKAIPPPASAERLRIVANRYELTASRSYKKVNGETFMVLSLRFRIFPPHPGTYTIGRATVRAEVQSGYKRVRDDFLPITRTVPNYRSVFAASEPIELVVKDLPPEGKPAGFTGAVGKYDVSLETADTQGKVGDPILLKTTITGTGLLEKIKRPLLSQDAEFLKRFSINESLAPGDISGNRITFEQTVRAKSEDVREIPSLAFPYFNPERGAYEIARSKPIPITVLPTTEVTAKDVISFEPDAGLRGTTRLEEQPGGILANYNHLDALRNQAVKWHLLSFLGLPPIGYLIVLTVVSRRRRLTGDLALARSKSARKVLKKRLAEASRHLQADDRLFCESLARAVSRFTSDKLNLGTGELTAYDIEMLAQQDRIGSETADKVADFLRECDAVRFAPSAQSPNRRRELLRQAEEVIKDLEKSL